MAITQKDFSKEYVRVSDIKVEIDHSYKNILVSRGLPKNFINYPAFSLQGHTTSFISETEFTSPISVSSKNQIKAVNDIVENPWHSAYTFCVSSMPNDMRAKSLVGFLMSVAIKLQLDAKKGVALSSKAQHLLSLKSLPLFESFSGGFESVTIKNHERPSLIVLSNITVNSTQHRIEKLRDTLEHFSDIPKIVCISGCDPLSFFNSKLFLNLSGCCYLTNDVVKGGEL